jgi:S-adenosylmethionine synthetase
MVVEHFPEKDPSKVDRIAAYTARFVAKNIVANGYATECTIAVSYKFGEESPSMLTVCSDNPLISTWVGGLRR